MNPSSLTRRVVIEQKSVTQDSYGAEVITWALLATVWASVTDEIGPSKGSEKTAEHVRVLETTTKIVIRYRADITSDMRVRLSDGSRTWQIVSIAEGGRRDATIMLCKEFTT